MLLLVVTGGFPDHGVLCGKVYGNVCGEPFRASGLDCIGQRELFFSARSSDIHP